MSGAAFNNVMVSRKRSVETGAIPEIQECDLPLALDKSLLDSRFCDNQVDTTVCGSSSSWDFICFYLFFFFGSKNQFEFDTLTQKICF